MWEYLIEQQQSPQDIERTETGLVSQQNQEKKTPSIKYEFKPQPSSWVKKKANCQQKNWTIIARKPKSIKSETKIMTQKRIQVRSDLYIPQLYKKIRVRKGLYPLHQKKEFTIDVFYIPQSNYIKKNLHLHLEGKLSLLKREPHILSSKMWKRKHMYHVMMRNFLKWGLKLF